MIGWGKTISTMKRRLYQRIQYFLDYEKKIKTVKQWFICKAKT